MTKKMSEKRKATVPTDYYGVFGARRYFRSAADANGTPNTVLLKVPTLLSNHSTTYRLPVGRLKT